MMKKHLLLMLFIISVSFASFGNNTLEEVIGRIKDQNLRKRLTAFMNQGVERYHPQGYNADSLLNAALQYKGARYRYGSSAPKAMDCSGLIYRSGKDIGIELPHQSLELARYGTVVTAESFRKGDMVFFRSHRRFIGHAGIMIDDKNFVHMSVSGGWTISSISEPYYAKNLLFGTRQRVYKEYDREEMRSLKPLSSIPGAGYSGRSLTLTAGLPR
jgi:hypothetical protein